MRLNKPLLAHTLLAGIVCAGAGYTATRPAQPEGPEDQQAAMAAWMELMQPGDAHQWLHQFVGDWDFTTRMWMDPAGPPMESQGRSTYEMILGDRFLKQTTDGQFMGMPHDGLGLSGFDNHRKQYQGMWVDSMGTAIYTMSGSLSQDGKTLTMFGKMDEPMTGEIGKTVKWVVRVLGKDRHVFEAWEVQYGDPFKVFEIDYTRRQGE